MHRFYSVGMKKYIFKILPFTLIALLIVAVSNFINLSDDALFSSFKSFLWISVSASGGKIGSSVLVLIACVIVTKPEFGIYGWGKSLLVLLTFSAALFIGLAQFNEFFIKEKLQVERPDIQMLAYENHFAATDIYTAGNKEERASKLTSLVAKKDEGEPILNQKAIQPRVWKHWLQETGYSFPSGHSVNAFLFATVFSYLLLLRYRKLSGIFFIGMYCWAVLVVYSRLYLKVHTSYDVSFGALWGTLLGFLLIITGVLDRIFKIALKRKKG